MRERDEQPCLTGFKVYNGRSLHLTALRQGPGETCEKGNQPWANGFDICGALVRVSASPRTISGMLMLSKLKAGCGVALVRPTTTAEQHSSSACSGKLHGDIPTCRMQGYVPESG